MPGDYQVVCTLDRLRWKAGTPRRERLFTARQETEKKERSVRVRKYAEKGFPAAEFRLFTKQEEVIRLCRSLGMTLNATGKKVGLSGARVKEIERKAQRKVEAWQRRCIAGDPWLSISLTAQERAAVDALLGGPREVEDGIA